MKDSIVNQHDQTTSIPNIGSSQDNAGFENKKMAQSFWYRKSTKTVMPVSAKEMMIFISLIIVAKISGGLISIIISLALVGWFSVIATHRGFSRLMRLIAYVIVAVGIITFTILYFLQNR